MDHEEGLELMTWPFFFVKESNGNVGFEGKGSRNGARNGQKAAGCVDSPILLE